MNESSLQRLALRARTRAARYGTWMLLTELFIGLGWTRAAVEKIIDGDWWTGELLSGFARVHEREAVGWYLPFLQHVVDAHTPGIALVVLVLQLLTAACLLTGRHRILGLGIGMFLNLHFLAAGAVSPSVFYLLAQGCVLVAHVERGPRNRVRALRAAAFGASLLVFLSLPFIRTLHPAEVIEDPAIMLVTGGTLAVLACWLLSSSVPDDAVASSDRTDTVGSDTPVGSHPRSCLTRHDAQ